MATRHNIIVYGVDHLILLSALRPLPELLLLLLSLPPLLAPVCCGLLEGCPFFTDLILRLRLGYTLYLFFILLTFDFNLSSFLSFVRSFILYSLDLAGEIYQRCGPISSEHGPRNVLRKVAQPTSDSWEHLKPGLEIYRCITPD